MGTGENACSLAVMTYNIEMKRSDDGWADRTLSKVVETITTANPDVVGLQEDTDDWYAESSGILGWTKTNHLEGLETAGYTYTNFSSNGDDERLNIFYKADKFNYVTSGRKVFKNLESTVDAPDGVDMSRDSQGRMFSYVVLEDKDTGAVVLIVNTHLHWRKNSNDNGGSNENALVRQYEARILRKWLDDMAEDYPNQIVMGDMNDTPGDTPLLEYTNGEGGFMPAMDGALLKGDVGNTLVSTSNYVERQDYIFDHVLYRNIVATEYSVIDNKIDLVGDVYRYPSDHLPVYSEFICYAE